MIIASDKSNASSLVSHAVGSGELVFLEKSDDEVLGRLLTECASYIPEEHNGRRLDCTLVFANSLSLWAIQTHGLPAQVIQKADIMATTAEDLLAKTILIPLPYSTHTFPPLDHHPIEKQSDTTVHLVIFGSNQMAEALALNAALISHYPNYCRDTRLRTRITLIDNNIQQLQDQLLLRHPHLFDHSWWRSLNLGTDTPRCLTHSPAYEGIRKDFVDIEWEFVEGNVNNAAVRQKLIEWSDSDAQYLTIALCSGIMEQNIATALTLPDQIYRNATPILCHSNDQTLLRTTQKENIHPFSYNTCSLGILQKLKAMAIGVNYVYEHCYSLAAGEEIVPPFEVDADKAEKMWRSLDTYEKQCSNLFCAMALGVKLRCARVGIEGWERFYALTRADIDLLAEVEHNRWSVEELLLGYRPPDAQEEKSIEGDVGLKKTMRQQKVHYDLRAFDDLRIDETGKNVRTYDHALTQAIPLILKQCITG